MTLPFHALVGVDAAQQALLLLAIDPHLRGVILAAPAGTGKSSLARGIQEILTDAPFINVPASIDAENLLGGLDLEATLHKGKIVTQQGVLSKADGGFIYIEGINLLTDASVNMLLAALDDGEVQVEREGISRRDDARFALIATYDPEEGVPRKHLLDRLGMITGLPAQTDTSLRTEVIHRHFDEPSDIGNVEDIEFLRGIIKTAREQLPDVVITDEQMQQLSALALAYGVEGHRVDLFAGRVARAAAAMNLRDEVIDDDLKLALELVILPRATRLPTPPPADEQQQEPPPPPPEHPPDDSPAPPPQESDEPSEQEQQQGLPTDAMPEQILEALESALPAEIDNLPFIFQRRGKTGSRGAVEGNRGRHVRSVPGDPRRNRIDIVGTLRAAAPWQPLRANANNEKTLNLELSDVRVKQYRSKAGTLFCFAVDASGSMAIHRMRQAKGAVHSLLEQAYVNRDRVALIAFRGERAELLLPPTQSVELAKSALDLLPTGGGTPLASALVLGVDVAAQARSRGIMQTVLVLLTDGRGNIPLREDAKPKEELPAIGAYVAESGVHSIVVDTKKSYLSKGEARQLADWLGGDYAYLPNASGEQIAQVASEALR